MRNPEKIRLVISDVDGTLLTPDGDLSPVDFVSVGRLRQAGIKFSLSSARPPFGMKWLLRMLEVDCTCAAMNGAVLFDPAGRIRTELPLERKLVEELEGRMRQCGLDVWMYTRDQWFVPRLSGPRVRHNTDSLRTAPERYAQLDEVSDPVLKLVGVSESLAALEACTRQLQREFANRASVIFSPPHFVDLTHSLADKGQAAVAITLTEGVRKDEVAAIGDSIGDIPMFYAVGLGVAMGQSNDEVRRAAAQVTRSNAENGLAWAIESVLSGKWVGQAARRSGEVPNVAPTRSEKSQRNIT